MHRKDIMDINNESSTKQQIRNLLTVLFSGLIAACLIAGFFLYYYGPTGKYVIKNTLLDPTLVDNLAYNDSENTSIRSSRYVFNGIEFSFYNSATKQSQTMQISTDKYKIFYENIYNDVSMLPVAPEVESLFNSAQLTTLSIHVRNESQMPGTNAQKTFQQVQIVPTGDYYRVELREQNSSNKWVYFYHPHIQNDILRIFVPNS